MLDNFKQISILNKIFNLQENEWARVTMAWFFRFVYRAGFVIGWTMIVGMFTGKFGIKMLPYLFVVNAFFTILGTFVYAILLEKFSKFALILATIAIAAFTMFLALFFAASNEVMFFALLIVAEAIFLMQLKVLVDGYVEDMFNPLESERTFPLIEASETVAGIAAGIAVTFLSVSIETTDFIYLWAILTILLVPGFLFHKYFMQRHFSISRHEEEEKKEDHSNSNIFTTLKEEFIHTKYWKYLKGVILIVFFQWVLFNLLEFQYTKAVYQNVSNVVMDGGSGFEHALVHDLGELFILFSSSALLVQLFVGSRLINSLGVVGSMILHALVTLLSFVGLTLNFNFSTAVLAKNNFTITGILYLNAYHSSYYALKEKLRAHSREFLEGIVRPLGALMGTFALILLQRFFVGNAVVVAVNILMVVCALIFLFVTYLQQNKYSEVAISDLLESKNKEERRDSVDILSQKGHKDSATVLCQVLLNEKEPISLRVHILRALGLLQSLDAVPDILECFKSDVPAIKEAAVDSLIAYKILGKSEKKYLLLEYEVVEALKNLYESENREGIRSKIITLLSKLSPFTTFDFLLKIIKSGHGNLKADAIYALKNYEDRHVIWVLKPYLKSKNPRYRINAAIALSKFEEFHEEVMYIIYSFLHSEDPKIVALGLYAIGEIDLKERKKLCLKYLDEKNVNLRMEAALALAKMGYRESIPVLIDLLFNRKGEIAVRIKKMLKNVDVKIAQNIDRIIEHIVKEEVQKLLSAAKAGSIEHLSKNDLLTLKWLYDLVEEYEDSEYINKLIN